MGLLKSLADVLDRTGVRLVLSLLILISITPLPLDHLWWAFFALFACELLVRALAFRGRRRGRASEAVVLVLDLVATLSFLPFHLLTPEARFLRLVRLAALVAYWFPFLRELVALTMRPERWRQLLFVAVAVLTLCAAAAIVLHHLKVPLDADGDGVAEAGEVGFGNAIWWAFRQVESPDNLVKEPSFTLSFFLSLLLTVSGFFLLSFFIGIATTLVAELVDTARLSRVSLRHHMVVLSPSPDSHLLLEEVFGYYRKQLRVPRVAVLGTSEQVPDYLRRRELRRLRYRTGNPALPAHLSRVDVEEARRVVVLKNSLEGVTDAQVVSTVMTVRELNPSCTIYAEVRRAESAAAAVMAGRGQTFPVLTREFQGLVLANLVLFPGMRQLLGELLSSSGQEIYSCLFGQGVMSGTPVPLPPPYPSWDALARMARASHGVQLIGAFALPETPQQPVGPLHLRCLPPETELQGLIGITDRFPSMKGVGADLARGRFLDPGPGDPGPPLPLLGLPSRRHAADRVLLCGFHEQTRVLLEQLARFEGELDVTLLVPTEAELRQARDALLAPSPRRLARRRVVFTQEEERLLRARLPGSGEALGLLRLVQADWSILQDLQAHALSHDVIVVSSDPTAADPDARTATGLLKLASLIAEEPGRLPPRFRIVGEVHDEVKAKVLEERFAELAARAGDDGTLLELISTHRLRNEFLAQCIVVPGVSEVLGELLSQGGEQLARLIPIERAAEGAVSTFPGLTARLAERQLLPIALELRDGPGSRVRINPRPGEPGYTFAHRDLVAVYVIGPVLEGAVPEDAGTPSGMDLAS